jgi:glycerol-3-phosphate cytidylyltransferase
MSDEPQLVGYVPGVFDMFHIGHLNILKRSRERCDLLIAGVVTDEECAAMKGYRPVIPFAERLEIVAANRYVDDAAPDGSADKRVAWRLRRFDVIFKGSDWAGTEKGRLLEKQMAEVGARVDYLPYTEHTSSTLLRETLARLVSAL